MEVAVSADYPFDYGKRIFFKYSSSRHRAATGSAGPGRTCDSPSGAYRLRAAVRLGDRLAGEGRVLRLVIEPVGGVRVPASFLRIAGVDVYVICHDVVPFVGRGEDLAGMVQARRPFYVLADRLIVHNENSIEDLQTVFGISGDKVRRFPFPIYDSSGMGFPRADVLAETGQYRFLFIGHLRQEKGVGVLLEAWARFRQRRQDVERSLPGTSRRVVSTI